MDYIRDNYSRFTAGHYSPPIYVKKRPFSSKLEDCWTTDGDAKYNYRWFINVNNSLFDKRQTRICRKEFQRKKWKHRDSGGLVGIINHNRYMQEIQRKTAFIHHWHDVPLFGSQYYQYKWESNGHPDVNEWCKENVTGKWNFSFELTGDGESRSYQYHVVYWFENKDDAMLCKLSFSK